MTATNVTAGEEPEHSPPHHVPSTAELSEPVSFQQRLAERVLLRTALMRMAFRNAEVFELHRERLTVFYTTQDSMLPAFRHGDGVIVLTGTAPGDVPLRRGEVVIFEDGWHAELEHSAKRVIGLPGEEIEIGAHQVRVNGEVLDEPYTTPPTHGRVGPLTLGPEECFAMGDNRSSSCDSRTHGPLPLAWIVGRALFRWWPPRRFGHVGPPAYAADTPAGGHRAQASYRPPAEMADV